MTQTTTDSTYKKLSFNLLTIALIGLFLYLGKSIFMPLFFAILLGSLLLPVINFLQSKKINRVISILLPLIIALAAIFGIIYFLSTQIANFFDDVPALQQRLDELSTSFQQWIQQFSSITIKKQNEYINETAEKVKTDGARIVGRTFITITEMLTYVVLMPIYTFLVLYYKSTIKRFLVTLFNNSDTNKVIEVIHESRSVSQRYIGGLLIETTIVFTLNSIGFLILGIKYPIFLALTAALLNLIPYIGMLIANIFCIIVTLITAENSSTALWVAVILALVQLFDNNFGMPWIVGNRVKINALVTIIGVLIGGALCGIPGMFLAIPGLAVLKVIFDRVSHLKPWGILLGDDSDLDKPLVPNKEILERKRKQPKATV